MRVAVIGPLEVTTNRSAPVPVPGAQERLLLGVLAAAAPEPISTERLIDTLWSGDPPPAADEALRGVVRDLRRALEPGLPDRSSGQFVLRRGPGYALAVTHSDVDALRFADLASRGHALLVAGDVAGAEGLLATALGLWRGEPFGDWSDASFAEGERRRLLAIRDGAEADLAQARATAERPVAQPREVRERAVAVVTSADPPPAQPSAAPVRPTSARDAAEPATAAARRPRTAVLVGGLVTVVVVALVGARWSAGADQQAQRSATLADADRLADLSAGEDHLDVALLLAAEAFRLADTPASRRGLTAALDGHERVERAASFSGTPQHPVLSGRDMLTFGIDTSLVGWPIAPSGVPRVLTSLPGTWGAWLVAAPSPVDGLALIAGAGVAGPWVRAVSTLDGSSRLLLEGDQVGGLPVGGAVSRDGRQLLLLVARPDEVVPDTSRWEVVAVDVTDGTRRGTGIGGVVSAPLDEVRADFADDAASFVVWDDRPVPTALMVQLADGQQLPIAAAARPGASLGFRAFRTGAVQLFDDGLFTVIDRAGTTIQAINVHQRPIHDVAVSPDGRWAVTAGAANELYRWDVDPSSGRWYGPRLLRGHADDVVGVEADADGRRLATVSEDHTAIVWDMGAGAEASRRPAADPRARLDAACAIVGRDLTPAEWRSFLPYRPWQPTCTDLH